MPIINIQVGTSVLYSSAKGALRSAWVLELGPDLTATLRLVNVNGNGPVIKNVQHDHEPKKCTYCSREEHATYLESRKCRSPYPIERMNNVAFSLNRPSNGIAKTLNYLEKGSQGINRCGSGVGKEIYEEFGRPHGVMSRLKKAK